MPSFSTIASASHARMRINNAPRPKAVPLTTAEQSAKREEREERKAYTDTIIQEWRNITYTMAQKLAKKYDRDEKYYLELFFQGGAHMIKHQEVINPYNAFKHEKAAEVREQGLKKNAKEIHRDHFGEYKALTVTEKRELVARFQKVKDENFTLHRDTTKGNIQDVSNVMRNMSSLLTGLRQRVGVEGFVCIVRGSTSFTMDPQWFFTSSAFHDYMPIATRKKWDTGEVGMKLEAFAIAGCDPANLLRSSKQKADWMKGEIRSLISGKLVDITGNADATMAYVWYEEDIVQRYGIVLEGWTGVPFQNISTVSTSLGNLRLLLDAIKTGECGFRKLSPEEAATRKAKWDADVAAGIAIPKHRAQRSDAGQKRKQPDSGLEEEEDTPGTDSPPIAAGAPAKKRARKSGDKENAPAKSRKTASKPADSASTQRRGRSSTGTAHKSMNIPASRDDEITRGVKARLRQRQITSRPIITSDDEEEDDPHANEPSESEVAAMAAVPST
ncbi:hypothetical protein MVEN_00005800 [Mycena venus]|uniref:Uncharacterized protein n=1 Tax=Mycena venus TaxID=2733690 RepID=A0A8H6Z980_9AGAR|nr:hypothetical protein MVEN_00005800 [Mycena venus]